MRRKSEIRVCFMVALVALIGMFLSDGPADAEFPDKPITVIVSYDAGSTTDLLARAIAVGTETALNTKLVFENKGGGGGTVAWESCPLRSPMDTPSARATAIQSFTPMLQKVPFKPLKSFHVHHWFAGAPHTALIVLPDAPWKTLRSS
jgi:tripartite-type tricarboxylate transporter receptor subunit TctC